LPKHLWLPILSMVFDYAKSLLHTESTLDILPRRLLKLGKVNLISRVDESLRDYLHRSFSTTFAMVRKRLLCMRNLA
jgi:hypothetical protein